MFIVAKYTLYPQGCRQSDNGSRLTEARSRTTAIGVYWARPRVRSSVRPCGLSCAFSAAFYAKLRESHRSSFISMTKTKKRYKTSVAPSLDTVKIVSPGRAQTVSPPFSSFSFLFFSYPCLPQARVCKAVKQMVSCLEPYSSCLTAQGYRHERRLNHIGGVPCRKAGAASVEGNGKRNSVAVVTEGPYRGAFE